MKFNIKHMQKEQDLKAKDSNAGEMWLNIISCYCNSTAIKSIAQCH